jgi:hypothetical protein
MLCSRFEDFDIESATYEQIKKKAVDYQHARSCLLAHDAFRGWVFTSKAENFDSNGYRK